ncbi:MAG: sulfurtransferase-like selenium metabolism protein YedF [Christensenellales bacterium]
MSRKQVNALGDACPMPVVKTKKALDEMETGQLEVLVDNETAVQNIRRYVESTGCDFQYSKQGEHFIILIEKTKVSQGERTEDSDVPGLNMDCALPGGKTIVVLSSEEMGNGDKELGAILMKSFVFALTQLDTLPDTVLLYNSGAKLSIQGAATLKDLITLEKSGVKIMTCGTCLNHFGIAEQLSVGEVTNMYNIVEEMRQASRILRP